MEKREIKFRCWNRATNQMYLSPNDIRHLGSWFDSHLPGSLAAQEYIEIMQYTGLKDKNGVEIYEGDIVRCSYGTGRVIWQDPIAAYLVAWIDDMEANMEFLGLERRNRRCRLEEDEVFEVIGNVHQHPELCSA